MASLPLPPPTATSAASHHVGADPSSSSSSFGVQICGSPVRLGMVRNTHLRILRSIRRKSNLEVKASKEPLQLTQDLFKKEQSSDPFEELKHRFLRFKKQNYLDNPVLFQNLAEAQAPKFMVVACADSRVCPSKTLGFQPGEAFTVRNVANIVPPFQHGTSETSAALQFAVNFLEVSNILVVGHSRCGGIRALMSMEESEQGNFTGNWVSLAKSARLSTKAAAGHLSFEQQCRHCEKESLNESLLNLLTYPWIEERAVEGKLSIHGGYYDFVDCSFEKWTLVHMKNVEGGSSYEMMNRTFWS